MYIIDDFFDNPDEIRSLALKQEYGKWGHDSAPGYRSKMIPLIDLNLWETLQSKLMSIPICRKMGVNSMKAEFAYVPENFGQGWLTLMMMLLLLVLSIFFQIHQLIQEQLSTSVNM